METPSLPSTPSSVTSVPSAASHTKKALKITGITIGSIVGFLVLCGFIYILVMFLGPLMKIGKSIVAVEEAAAAIAVHLLNDLKDILNGCGKGSFKGCWAVLGSLIGIAVMSVIATGYKQYAKFAGGKSVVQVEYDVGFYESYAKSLSTFMEEGKLDLNRAEERLGVERAGIDALKKSMQDNLSHFDANQRSSLSERIAALEIAHTANEQAAQGLSPAEQESVEEAHDASEGEAEEAARDGANAAGVPREARTAVPLQQRWAAQMTQQRLLVQHLAVTGGKKPAWTWNTNKVVIAIIYYLMLYLIFNIVGSVYFVKLASAGGWDYHKPVMQGALSSLIIGWLGIFPANLTSPLVYATQKHRW